MSWLPKRDKLDPVQASAVDFVVAQEGNFYIKGEAGTGKSVVLAHVAARYFVDQTNGKVVTISVRQQGGGGEELAWGLVGK